MVFISKYDKGKSIANTFTTYSFSHIRRQGNSTIHNIARLVSDFLV